MLKLFEEGTWLMNCLVCGAKQNAIMKPGPGRNYLPENRERVIKAELIHHDEKSSK
jgi:hypothetical protein